MTVLVLGISHHTASVSLLDEVAVAGTTAQSMLDDLIADPRISEAMVLATCNRLEVYAVAPRFHPAVNCATDVITRHSGIDAERLRPHLFVHHAEAAAEHLFMTASGLDSMVSGESQIRFQVRGSLQSGRASGAIGPVLSDLVESALRVGKRAQTEAHVDETGRSLADEGFAALAERGSDVAGGTVLVLGAGSMASVAAVAADRHGPCDIVVVNRDRARGVRLADAVRGVAASWDDLPGFLGKADVLVACTGAAGTLVDADMVRDARRGSAAPLGVLDLAMPHDVDSDVGRLPGVTLVSMTDLAERIVEQNRPVSAALDQARLIVAEEVSQYVAAQSAAAAVPTVVALRQHAHEVVEAEIDRLRRRVGDRLPADLDDEVSTAVRRVVGKLLHTPTMRVKEAAADGSSTDYEAALAHLFALDPAQVSAVSRRESQGRP